jgi:predicted O-methyltransferase YrrM
MTLVEERKRTVPTELRTLIESALTMDPVPHRLEGWTTAERGVEMAELVCRHKPQTIVQIGIFGGRSLIAQAMALRHNGMGKIYGIDPWRLDAALEGENDDNRQWWAKVDLHAIHRLAMEAIWHYGLDSWAVVLRARSEHCPQLFAGGIDILEIDGNHSEVASCRDVELYAPMLAPGAYVHFDDADWASTQKALRMLEKWCGVVEDRGHYRLYKRRDE